MPWMNVRWVRKNKMTIGAVTAQVFLVLQYHFGQS
jgi:hypothetical protein